MREHTIMEVEIENRVREQFGRTAGDYTQSRVHSDPDALNKIVTLAQVRPGDVALDIATGAGHVAMALAPRIAEVIAYDLTEEMLQEAQRNAAARGLSNITTKRGKAEQLPFPDGTFDIVTVRQAPHHFGDIQSAIREMARVAKEGARIVIVDSYAPDDPILDRQWNHIEKLRDPSHVRNYTPREWRELVSSAGLHITFEELDHCTENGRPMNFVEWTRRMKTPPSTVDELVRLFSTASSELRELLRVETADGEIRFCVPQITMVALR
jgi:ubiquinone/menaquinone biosynthesis C-methylase UbiE